jgi:hypothetical protein
LSEPNGKTIAAKLRKLPGELLLALVNATAILVIIAAVLALIAIKRVDNFAGNLAATMTEAALSKIDLPSREVLANLRNLTEEVRRLADTLQEIREGEHPVLQSEIARLKEAMSTLGTNVDRLTNARTILTDEAIGRLARSVGTSNDRYSGLILSPATNAPHVDSPIAGETETHQARSGRAL